MRLPNDRAELGDLIDDVIQACEVSQQDRLSTDQSLRNYVLFGCDWSNATQQIPAAYNNIWPTLQDLSSMLYAQESVNFSVKWGASVPKEQAVYGEAMRKKAHEIWEDTGTDQLFGEAVFWSLGYGSQFLKVIYNGGPRVYPVLPHMIGVYREDIPSIDNQEAITHLYYQTMSGLRTTLRMLPESRRDEILAKVTTVGSTEEGVAPATVSQMILMGQQPTVRGAINPVWESRYQYRPQTEPELVEMKEVWIYADELEDYRVFTIASPRIVVFDRKGSDLCIKGEHPFIKITPFPLQDFLWGQSLCQNLVGLQDWHQQHLTRVDLVYQRKLRPTRTFTGPGWANLTDEKMKALDTPGGQISSAVPGAKVDTYVPEISMQEAVMWLHEIDDMFYRTAGLGANIMRAQGDEGVRSMQHAQVLQRMGSSRIKKTALIIEDPAEKLATMLLKMEREHSKVKLLDDTGKEFLLSQVDGNFSIKVSGHSLSPVFVEDTKQEAKALVQMKAMTRERYIDETKPPMAEELKHDLETKIEPAETQAAKANQGLQLMKVAKNLK